MLQAMRQASKSLVMKIILSLLALTFVVFFGNSFVGSGGSGGAGSIVEVGDVSYNAYDINRAFGDRIQRAQANPNLAGMTQQQAIQLGLLDQTISELVTRTLFDLGAQGLGITASDADASALVRQVPQFQNSAGRFDRIQFESYLRNAGLSEQQYISQLRADLVRNQLLGTLAFGVKTPTFLIDRFYQYNAERRIAELATIPSANVPAIAAPDDAQLAAYLDANKARFETPEYRTGLLVSLTVEDFAREIGVPDADIAAAYQANAARYVEPERRHVVSALFADKTAADKAADRMRAGEDFVTVVKDVTGSDPADLGLVTREGTLVDEIGAATFAAAEPGLVGPFESPFGWNLARVSDITPRVEKTLADVRDEIARDIAVTRARERIFDVLESFEDALAGGASLEDAAKETGIVSRTVGPVSRDGFAPGADAANNPDPQMLANLFSTDEGRTSAVVERNNGGFFAVRVNQIDAPRVPPLAEIRDKVTTAWIAEQQAGAAERIAGEIVGQARDAGSLVAAAAKAGFTAQTTAPFDRVGQGADIPPEAVDLLFEAKAGDVISGATTEGAFVARLVEVVAPPTDAPERNQLRGALAQSIANDIQVQLAAALRGEHPVDIDTAELQRLYAPQ
jgi:peptidyl-prolyl cis-trans isomerase D